LGTEDNVDDDCVVVSTTGLVVFGSVSEAVEL
jgi:hypothetical protein